MHFLVIGIGSIGERHIKNLRQLGVSDISVYDKYADIFHPNSGLPDLTPQLTKLDRIIQEYDVCYADPHNYHTKFDAFIICTPPASHLEYIVMGMQHFSNIFVEKPISNELTYLDWVVQTARNKGLLVQVGYQLRFCKSFQDMEQRLNRGEIGKLVSIQSEYGNYLPNWRPNTDYKMSYSSKLTEGGGAILECSHELEYVLSLANSKVTNIKGLSNRNNPLGIEVESLVDILLEFENGITANIHLDLLQRNYVRQCRLIGEKGELTWNFSKEENDSAYISEMQDFINCIQTKRIPMVDSKKGYDVLVVALKCRDALK